MVAKNIRGRDVASISRSFKDITTSFAMFPPTKDVATVSNSESIKQAIKNIILTSPGEKLFNYDFGSRVYALLFEPFDPFTVDKLRDEILNTINNYEPRVVVLDLIIVPNFDEEYLNVELQYQIVGQPVVENIDFILRKPG